MIPIAPTLRTDQFRIRFLFGSDQGITDEGWYIDDVELFLN